jgi:hypothetical protein
LLGVGDAGIAAAGEGFQGFHEADVRTGANRLKPELVGAKT